MDILLYNNLNTKKINGFSKFAKFIGDNNFTAADIKKVGDNLYRAKLNKKDRLVFSLHRHKNINYCLVLEYIPNHDYDKSRFLSRNVQIDEDKIPQITDLENASSVPEFVYLNKNQGQVYFLDKAISFDDAQQAIYNAPSPVIIIGSAGSGKTALTLEKMKNAIGDILYISHSPYLVQNARDLYYNSNYHNEDQEQVDFLSFKEYLETISVPKGREVTHLDFKGWFQKQHKSKDLKSSHKLFEEFRGVLTGASTKEPWLRKDAYLELGVRQSLFAPEIRGEIYDLFEKYLKFIETENLYDTSIISQQYLSLAKPRYDFVIVDEVQDLTNIQLKLILKSLRNPAKFILCGDANQIVHPNFFSWSKIKSLFFSEELLTDDNLLRILHANYRNSPLVTAVANRILTLKHARFGSVDKESNYLVDSVGAQEGSLQLLENTTKNIKKLDESTAVSTKFAVIVMHNHQKEQAQKIFSTPLVFSIQEAKGLEYDSIILYDFISAEEAPFKEIAKDVTPESLNVTSLSYARAKNKNDKSLEVYKFYINALYVAITRSVRNLYIVESQIKHPIIKLLDLERFVSELSIEKQTSSIEEWQQEARKLELQGKQEQAKAIHDKILQEKPVPWTPITQDKYLKLVENIAQNGKKERFLILEYALLHGYIEDIEKLSEAGFKPAIKALQKPSKAVNIIYENRFMAYGTTNPYSVIKDVETYGVDHRVIYNLTPLMTATIIGNINIMEALLDKGSNINLIANNGLNAWQFLLGQILNKKRLALRLQNIYPRIAPSSISVQIDGKLEKLDENNMATFLLNVFISTWYNKVANNVSEYTPGITAQMLEEWLQDLPDNILPAMKKRRIYISRYLSENEVDRKFARNKKLFKRLKRGHYILNAQLKIKVADQWHDIYRLLSFEGWGRFPKTKILSDFEQFYEEREKEFFYKFKDFVQDYSQKKQA